MTRLDAYFIMCLKETPQYSWFIKKKQSIKISERIESINLISLKGVRRWTKGQRKKVKNIKKNTITAVQNNQYISP